MGKEKIEKMPIPEEELKEKKEQTEEIQRLELDPNEKIDIVIKEVPGGDFLNFFGRYRQAQVTLEKDKKVIEDFQNELPKVEFYFKERNGEKKGKRWCYDRELKKILMPQMWESSKDGLTLMHEIGHGLYFLKHPGALEKKGEIEDRKDEVDFQLYVIKERGTIWHRGKAGEIPEERPVTERDKKRIFGEFKELYQKLIPLSAKAERGAWAEGLNLVRKLKREKGIDLLNPFRGETPEETRKNLEEFVHGLALSSYERGLREDIEERELSPRLKGVFTKKYKKEVNKKAKEVSEEVSEEASKI